MTMPGFSANNWSNFYLNKWSNEVVFSTSKTLAEEYKTFLDKLDSSDDAPKEEIEAKKRLKKDFYGSSIWVDRMPHDLQVESMRAKLNIPPHVWDEYDAELQGRVIATEVINGQIESIKALEKVIEDNEKRLRQKSESKTTSPRGKGRGRKSK